MFSFLSGSQEPVTRTAEEQNQVDAQTAKLKLYQYDSCPFCARVRNHIELLNLNIEHKNTQLEPQNRADLIAGGGKGQVPALRIEDDNGSIQWMYESSDIMAYLSQRFA